MTISTYSELTSAVATWSSRNDLTSQIDEFVLLCEADMQTRLKLLEFETTATVTITAGTGSLPAGFLAARSVYWDGDPDRPIQYVTPEKYDDMRVNDSGDGYFYTIVGGSIMTTPMGDGSIVMTHSARFVPLSDANTTNAILTDFPNAYLFGSLLQLALFIEDDAAAQKWGTLYNSVVDRMNRNNEDRKYAGPLVVRAR